MGVVNDFDLLLLAEGLGLVDLNTFLSVLIFLGAPPAAEALDVAAVLAEEEVVLAVGAEAGLPPAVDFVVLAAFLVAGEAVLVVPLEGRLAPVTDVVDFGAFLVADEVVLALVAEDGLLSVAVILDVDDVDAFLVKDDAVLELEVEAEAGLPAEPFEVVDPAELGRRVKDSVWAEGLVPDEDFREVAEVERREVSEVALSESCDLQLVVLAPDGTRLNSKPIAPTAAFPTPDALLPAFAASALVGVEDLEEVDVAGDFTRLKTGGLGSYMLVRRPLVAAAFCAAPSSTGLSHFTTLALGPTTFDNASEFAAAALLSSFFALFLLPSLRCLTELG